ncbi:magnesium transporter nipa3-like [Nannochloropsis oceanica]
MGVPTWSVGVIINVIGSISINFGTNLMKFAHNEKNRQRKEIELSEQDSEITGGDQRIPSTSFGTLASSSSKAASSHLVGASSNDSTPPTRRPSLQLMISHDDEDTSSRTPITEPRRRTFAEYRDHVVASFSRGLRLYNLSPRSARAEALADSSNGEPDDGTSSSTSRHYWRPRRLLSSYVTPSGDVKELMRKKFWHIGAFILLVGSICTFVSFSYAPQSMLAALGSVQFLSNVFFARFVLSEKITLRVILATCIIIAGQILIVVYSPHKSREYDAHSLIALYDRIFLIYMGVLVVIGGGLIFIYRHYKKRKVEGRELSHTDTVLPVTYAMTSAMIGTFSVLQAKCLSELLRRTINGDNQLKFFYTWFVLLVWLFLTVFWLHRMNTALRLFDGIFIIPVLQVFWTLFAIMTGGIYFQEFQEYSSKMLALFVFGVLIIFSGVALLSPRQTTVEAEELFEEILDEEGASSWRGMDTEEESSPSSSNSPPPPSTGDKVNSLDDPGQINKGHDGHGKGSGRQQQAPQALAAHQANIIHPLRGISAAAMTNADCTGEEEYPWPSHLIGISRSPFQALVADGDMADAADAAASDSGGDADYSNMTRSSRGGESPSKPLPPQIQSKPPTNTKVITGSAACRASSLDVLDNNNSCLFSFCTLPFIANDQDLTNFLAHVTPTLLSEDPTSTRSVCSSSHRTTPMGECEKGGQANVVPDCVGINFSCVA